MIDVEEIFRYKNLDEKKLASAGFCKNEGIYTKNYPIMDGQFFMEVTLSNKAVRFRVFEAEFEEEYVLVHTDAAGGFVGEVREACERVLRRIAAECYTPVISQTEQTKRLFAHIAIFYGIEPEFLWEDSPEFAVFRRKDNQKWFGIVMNIPRGKIGLDGGGNIDIINLKDSPENVKNRLDGVKFIKAYHMNKTHWYSVRLDGQIEDEALFSLLSVSFNSVKK